MREQNKIEVFITWFLSLFERYNCDKNRHRWGYLLSKSGVVYMDDRDVPKELWGCLDCEVKKFTPNQK